MNAISEVREGNAREHVHETAVQVATEVMIELCILKNSLYEAL